MTEATSTGASSLSARSLSAWPFVTHAESAITVRFSSSNSEAPAPPPRFAVGYWSIRGLAAPIRMMLCAAKQDHIVYLYDCLEGGSEDAGSPDEWIGSYFATEKARLRDTYQNAFMNLPFIVDQEHQLLLTQSNACLQYVGECVNMMGGANNNPQQRALCAQLLCELYDLRNIMVEYAYADPPPPTTDAQQAAATVCIASAREHWTKLEQHLDQRQCSCFLVGDTFSAPDFCLFEMVDQFDQLSRSKELPDCFADFPHVRAFHTAFAELPENQFYLHSIFHQGLPLNYPTAHFGSAPGPATYVRGQTKTTSWMQLGHVKLTASSPADSVSPCRQW